MKQKIEVIVVKDSEGVLRPMAQIWLNNEHGKISAELYLKKPANSDCTIVVCELIEK